MRTRILGAWIVGALPLTVSAQTPAPTQEAKGAAQVGGVSTIDYITLRAGNLGAPLRFGHVIQGSERVEMGGRVLTPTQDYAVDYETGVVYLKMAQRTGDNLVVAYRYDPQGKATGGATFAGVNSFLGLSLAPGLGLVGGLGVTERAADGSVLSSNVFGWNNSLKFGGNASLGGLFLYSERKKNDNVAGLAMDQGAKPGDASTDEGASQFLVQNFRSALMGGNVSVDYQDISKNFASGGQVKAAGYSDADVAKYMKERGLKRQGASLSGLKLGAASFGASFKQVDDGATGKGLDWSSYGFQQGGLKMSMSSQRVERGFTRFGDLAEGDRDQLAKEAGMSRQNLAMEFAQKAGKFSFSSAEVTDDGAKQSAIRREAKLDTGRIGLTFGEQQVDRSFARIGSLTGAEQGQWGREVGVKRQWMGLNAALGGKTTPQNFAFNQLDLTNATGSFKTQDVSYASKSFNLGHFSMSGNGTGLPMGALQDAEGNAAAKRIASFFGNVGTNDSHRQSLLAAGDVKRDLTNATGTLGKAGNFSASHLKFGEGENGGSADAFAFNTPKVQASIKRQEFGQKFSDATRLMDFERASLGTVAGLQRTDISFGVQIDKTRKFAFGQTSAKDAGGDLGRTTLAYAGKGIEINAAQRDVSKGFTNAAGLVDPENTLLAQFQGFQERDANFKYTGTPGLKIQASLQQAMNESTKEGRSLESQSVDWTVDKLTSVSYLSTKTDSRDPLTTLFAQSMRQMSLTHTIGKFGTFQYLDQQIDNSGTNNPAPDMHKQYFALEAKIDPLTSLKTEQTRTDYDNGDKENISANTVTRAVSKTLSVSVTGVSVDRKGDDNDEKKTNYGFSYDFGKGLKLTYGYAQSLVGQVNGTGSQMFTFGQANAGLNPTQTGQVGASNVSGLLMGGGYGANTYMAADGTRTQSFANFNLANAKPLAFGGFTEVKFSFGLDTAADYSQYLRENHTAGISGKLGKNVFSFGYRGQVANPSANPAATPGADPIQAIDRSVALSTDASPKAPLVVAGSVKLRTLPDDKEYTSRNVSVTARPIAGVEVTNVVQTNLEQANPNVLLGSTLLADRGNKWLLNFKGNGDTSFGASWEEKSNDTTQASSVLGAVNLTLFQKSGCPLRLTYGVDQVDGNVPRRQITRYSLQFDAKSSANQTLSMYVGNVDYAYNVTDASLKGDNWTMRLNYQIRF